MVTKKCPNCGKFMIEWKSQWLTLSMPKQERIDFKCACGHSELSRYEPILQFKQTFKDEWEKANGE